MADSTDFWSIPAFCDNALSKPAEMLFCVRPREPKMIDCGSSAMYARIISNVDQTLKVEHHRSRPVVGDERSSESRPSGFASFTGGCEVFLDEITCFGGNGQFGALPLGHTCGAGLIGGLNNPLALSCSMNTKGVDCQNNSNLGEEVQFQLGENDELATVAGVPPSISPGIFVFGDMFLGNGLGDAAFFVAACMHQPTILTSPSNLQIDYGGVDRVRLADLDDLNAKLDFDTPDLCWVLELEDLTDLLTVPAPCNKGGEVLFCNRPRIPRFVDCAGSAMYGRIGSNIEQTLHVEHFPFRPAIGDRGSVVPTNFYSFYGGCEVFLDDITCFGGNGEFAALPFDHRCTGVLWEQTELACSAGSKRFVCDAGQDDENSEGTSNGSTTSSNQSESEPETSNSNEGEIESDTSNNTENEENEGDETTNEGTPENTQMRDLSSVVIQRSASISLPLIAMIVITVFNT